jgi:glycosyltransferase involved in cell wall biosynthesis
LVFHSTRSMGNQLVELGVVERDRLVQAPFGVAPEFSPNAPAGVEPPAVHSANAGRPYLLNVAGAIPRKRLDVLVAVFQELRRRHPELLLVQVGARTLPTADPDTAAAILQPGPVDDLALAALYRGATAVCVTSQAEGFGLPVLEALACGALVVSSDLENVREVAGDAALYLPVGDVPAWVDLVDELLEGRLTLPTLSQRLDQAAPFTWERHARVVLDGYRRLTS